MGTHQGIPERTFEGPFGGLPGEIHEGYLEEFMKDNLTVSWKEINENPAEILREDTEKNNNWKTPRRSFWKKFPEGFLKEFWKEFPKEFLHVWLGGILGGMKDFMLNF